jgi:hypothetical protein
MRHKIRLEGAVTPDAVREQYVYLPTATASAREIIENMILDCMQHDSVHCFEIPIDPIVGVGE